MLRLIILLTSILLVTSHEHSDEPGHFKYSREANEDLYTDNSQSNEPHHGNDLPRKDIGRSWFETSAYALLSTAFISISPIVILLFIHLDNSAAYEGRLKVLLAFASGGLLGDSFLHLIPHAIMFRSASAVHHSHSHSHSHSHEGHSHDLSVELWVLCGLLAFLLIEKLIKAVKGSHSHSHVVKAKESDDNESSSEEIDEEPKPDSAEVSAGPTDIKVAGYLNLAADFSHNFTDGLAIGASYLAGQNLGIITTATIFLHEIPHEIGDYAILVQSGCTRKQAMLLQFSTAIGAMLGTVVSLIAGGVGEGATAWILPFTAGGFIYIATVSVLPELLHESKFWQSVKEVFALIVGIALMVVIAVIE